MAETAGEQTVLVPVSARQFLRVLAIGAVVGLMTWGLTVLLDQYVFKNIICKGMESMQCAGSLQYANISASILSAGVALFVLAKLLVFRALLVVIAATVGLWGIAATLQPLGWQFALPAMILLSMAAYGLFAWVGRLRSVPLALIIVIVLVASTRFVLNL